MIQVVYGNEPYLIDQVKNKIISSTKNLHMNILRAQTFSEDVYDFLYAYLIFDDKRVALLDIDVLSQLDSRLFNTYISNPSAYSDLFIQVRNFDARTIFAAKLKKWKL